jgi:Lipocalin-like domain
MTSNGTDHSAAELVGTWKLVDASSKTSAGEKIDAPYGIDPVGFLTYTAEGRISSVISYGGRKPLSMGGGKIEEQAEAFKTFLAYAGRYTLSGDKVTHHIEVSSVQNYVDRDLVRTIKFEDDRITLTTPPTPVNGKIQTLELVWRRVAADS